MTEKQAKVGKSVIVKKKSTSKYAGEVLTIASLNNGYANLTQNNEVQIINMPIKFLR